MFGSAGRPSRWAVAHILVVYCLDFGQSETCNKLIMFGTPTCFLFSLSCTFDAENSEEKCVCAVLCHV